MSQGLLLLSLYTVSELLESFIPSLKSRGSHWPSQLDVNILLPGLTTFLRHISFPVAILISLLSWGLGIPVDYRGLATFKNHFFHSLNTVSCLLSMLVTDQEWQSSKVILPFRYGIAYAIMQWILQSSGDSFIHWSCCMTSYLGQPVLYDFLDFQNNLGLALFVVMGCSLILPLIHMGLCHLADKIRDFKMMSNVNKK